MNRSLIRMVVLIALGLTTTVALQARSKKSRAKKPASFDYYMLVLSYAPDFCAQPTGNKDPRECGNGRKVGFVVHGLWPQGETTRGPENCGSSPVAKATVQAMLNYFPTESLIQHEWTTHGSCTGLTADDYFATVKKARDSVTVPAALTSSSPQSLAPADIETRVSSANPSFPKTAFRTSCYADKELEEVRICLNKDLSPRPCGSSAGECTANTVTLLPVH